MKNKNISFVPQATKNFIEDKLNRKITLVTDLESTLKEYGELPTLATMREYKTKGADFRRKAIIADCEAYIRKTAMPGYLQADSRKRAYDEIPDALVRGIADCLDGIDFDLTDDVVCYDSERQQWAFTEAYREAELEKSRRTLTDAEMADLGYFTTFCEIYHKLADRYLMSIS